MWVHLRLGRAAAMAVAGAWLVAGCGGASPSRAQLSREGARTVVSDYLSNPLNASPQTSHTTPANRAKLALVENIDTRFLPTVLPKAFVYCVAYRAGIEYPASGLARLSLPADPAIGGFAITANFRRVEKQLAIECLTQEGAAFRPVVNRDLGQFDFQTIGSARLVPSYRTCFKARLPTVFAGARLGHLLAEEYARPRIAAEREYAAGYHSGIGCMTEPRTAAAFRSALASELVTGLARRGFPAAFLSCVAATVRAELTASEIRNLLALPTSELDRIVGSQYHGAIEQALLRIRQQVARDIAIRDRGFFSAVGRACVARTQGV